LPAPALLQEPFQPGQRVPVPGGPAVPLDLGQHARGPPGAEGGLTGAVADPEPAAQVLELGQPGGDRLPDLAAGDQLALADELAVGLVALDPGQWPGQLVGAVVGAGEGLGGGGARRGDPHPLGQPVDHGLGHLPAGRQLAPDDAEHVAQPVPAGVVEHGEGPADLAGVAPRLPAVHRGLGLVEGP